MNTHQEKFDILVNHGVFDVHFGKVEINLSDGLIQNVYIYERVYKYSK
jgi:hypothetical protein